MASKRVTRIVKSLRLLCEGEIASVPETHRVYILKDLASRREVASFVGTEGYYEAQTLAAKLDGRPEGTTLAFSFRVIGPYRIEKVKTRMTVEG